MTQSQHGDDWPLVARVKTGDQAAFDAIMQRYKRPILNFVYRMTGDADEAQDVAQDVFVRAYHGIMKPGFRAGAGMFSTWLFQIARNAALDRLRSRRRRPVTSLDKLADSGYEPAQAGKTPAEQLDISDLGRGIAGAIGDLPEDQRTALVLFEYEGFSQARIAEIMRCSVKSVDARLYRARRTLRRRLKEWGA